MVEWAAKKPASGPPGLPFEQTFFVTQCKSENSGLQAEPCWNRTVGRSPRPANYLRQAARFLASRPIEMPPGFA